MKKLILSLLTLILLTTLGCSSCKKNVTAPDNPYGLPNATQTGANTMGCLVNNKLLILQNSNLHFSPTATLTGDSILEIGGSGGGMFFQGIGFQIKHAQVVVGYNVDNNNDISISYGTDSTCLGGSFNVITVTATRGVVTLTKLDKANHIVSGTFNCKIPISNCDTLNITNGRFDIWLQIK